jgi:hypothetical protein
VANSYMLQEGEFEWMAINVSFVETSINKTYLFALAYISVSNERTSE